MSTSEDKVSVNAKHLVLAGIGLVGVVAAIGAFVPAVSETFLLPIATGVLGFLAGMADKLWGK